jgi:hypothetical protein
MRGFLCVALMGAVASAAPEPRLVTEEEAKALHGFPATYQARYPQLVDFPDRQVARSVNAQIRYEIDKALGELGEYFLERTEEGLKSEGPVHCELRIEPTLFNDELLALTMTSSYEWAGGPEEHRRYSTFDVLLFELRHDGERVSRRQLFVPGREALDRVRAKASDALRAHYDRGETPVIQRSGPVWLDQVFPNRAGLVFLWNPGRIAARELGELAVFLSYEELEGLLNPKLLSHVMDTAAGRPVGARRSSEASPRGRGIVDAFGGPR